MVGCNALRTPPLEIVRQGMQSTIAYLRRLSTGSVECYRTKLMLVGLGGAGKYVIRDLPLFSHVVSIISIELLMMARFRYRTSTMRALMSPDHRSTSLQNEGITDGIQISSWSHTVPETAGTANKTITYSIWDFAGTVLMSTVLCPNIPEF